METANYGKKQYFILLVLSVVTALLIPLICDIYTVFVLWKTSTGLFGAVSNIILSVVFISGVIGLAVLIFSAMRFRFKLCLPFVGVAVLATILSSIVALAVVDANRNQTYSFAVGITNTLQICALQFAFVGIARFCAKHIKKEIIAVPVAFLIIEIANWIIDGLLSVFYSFLLIYFNVINTATFSYNNLTNISDKMAGTYLKSLRYFICLNIAYLIIRLLFAKNKREKFRKISATVKNTTKKLWGATAK